MVFPIGPATNDRHEEAGVPYIWTGASWDVDISGQVLVTSTVDPTVTDTADIHTVWRNTTDGSAWQREEIAPDSPIPGAGPLILTTEPLAIDSTAVAQVGPVTFRQSFFLTSWTTITDFRFLATVDIVGGTFNPGTTFSGSIFKGQDSTSAMTAAVGSLALGTQVATSNVLSVPTSGNTPGFGGGWTLTFSDGNLLAPGTYTVVIEYAGTDFLVVAAKDSLTDGQVGNDPAHDLNFSLFGNQAQVGGWVPIVKDATIQIAGAAPTTQPGGGSLIAGDLWVSSIAGEEGVLYYWDGIAWVGTKTFYNNTIQGFLVAQDEQAAINELDVYIDRLEGGINFVGTYAPSTNTADFTTASGLPDGTLPAANTVGNSFLVVTEQAIGQAPAPAVQMNRGDFLVADPVANTWTLIPVGTAIDEFTNYPDTPSSYVGNAEKVVSVNATETGLEFITASDTHTNRTNPAPVLHPNGNALAAGDYWQDTVSNLEKFYDGAAWQDQVYVEVTAGTVPTQVYSGKLWYDTDTGTLYVYDVSATNKWVAI